MTGDSLLVAALSLSVSITVLASLAVAWILYSIERQNFDFHIVDDIPRGLELEVDDTSSPRSSHVAMTDSPMATSAAGGGHNNTDGIIKIVPQLQSRPVELFQKVWIAGQVCVLVLLNYLLLVYVPASPMLSLLGALLVWCVTLHIVITDELVRRHRSDRLWRLLTLCLVLASSMSYAVYAQLAIQEGHVYQGPARIIGYDMQQYNNSDGLTLRTDLQVTWGGPWGCPNMPDKVCQAQVSGALCQAKYNPQDFGLDTIIEETNTQVVQGDDRVWDNNNGTRQRRLANVTTISKNYNSTNATTETPETFEPAVYALSNATSTNNITQQKQQDEVNKDEEQLEQQIQELETENESLQSENEALEEDLETEEDYAEDLADEFDYDTYEYGYDDDIFEDNYWSDNTWEDVWGEYACEDLFSSDVAGEAYNANIAPGKDDWPYVQIFGTCQSCQAYLVDYYASEHFQSIQAYRSHGLHYALAAAVVGLIALFTSLKQKYDTPRRRDLELLGGEFGVAAA